MIKYKVTLTESERKDSIEHFTPDRQSGSHSRHLCPGDQHPG